MHIEEMTRLFLDSRKRGTDGARKRCTEATISIYTRNLSIFQSFMLSGEAGNTVIEYKSLRRANILSLVDWIDAKIGERQWSKATALQFWRVLRSFFHWVDKDEDCQAENLRGMQRYLPVIGKTPRKEFIPMTQDLRDFRNAYNTDRSYGFRNYVAFSLMLDSGIRCGELCNLKLEDILEKESLIIVDGKTGRRAVPITDSTMKLLRAWLKRRNTTKMGQTSKFVFVSKYDERISVNGMGQSFRKMRKKFGLSAISPHSLRHAFGTFYMRNGGGLENLRSILGHSTYEMTKEYLHMAKVGGESAKKELEKVSVLKSL